MCSTCEREDREAAEAEAQRRATEPRRILNLRDILKGDPCYTYSSLARDRFSVAGMVEVTVSLAIEQADDWDWYWAGNRLLTAEGARKYFKLVETAEDEYNEALRPYRDLLDVATNKAQKEYNRLRDDMVYLEAVKVYNSMRDLDVAAFEAAEKVASKRWRQVMAKTFAEIFISEEGTDQPTGNDNYLKDYEDSSEDY